MTDKFPTTFKDLQTELLRHAQDGRSDATFRLVIAMSQVGPVASHLTHDPTLNPIARPYGTRKGEIHDCGHMLVQIMTYVALRGIDIEEAINEALVNLREKDFLRVEAQVEDEVRGSVVSIGSRLTISGVACVVEDLDLILSAAPPQDTILVATAPGSAHTHIMKQFAGIITDNGSMGCHAAIVSREFDIPCIVGTGNATRMIKTGDLIHMYLDTGLVTVNKE